MAAETDRSRYFAPVDGLRALAVLTVMLFHLDAGFLPGGYIGVDIFFVISGFVVTASVAHRKMDGLFGFQIQFYARRVLRILPALTVCLLATSVAYALFVPSAWLSAAADNVGLAAFGGASNIVLALTLDNYFSPRTDHNPFTHTWSLGVEEQFYLIFPMLIWAHNRFREAERGRYWTIAAIVGLCVASLAICAYLSGENWGFAFYMLPARFWELGAGMLLYLAIDRWRPWLAAAGPAAATGVGLSGVVLIAATCTVPSGTYFPFPLAIAPVVGACALIAIVVSRPDGWLGRAFGAPSVVFVGRLSYSLYLWHWPVYVLMRWTVGLVSWPQYLAAVVMTGALALLSFYFVERPFRSGAVFRKAPAWAAVAGGLAVVLTCAAGTALLFRGKDHVGLSQTAQLRELWYPNDNTTPANAPAGCKLESTTRPLEGGTVKTWRPVGCVTPQGPGRLIVAGDSHALAYVAMFKRAAMETGREVVLYNRSSCPFLDLQMLASEYSGGCSRFAHAAAADIGRQAGRADRVFLPSLRVERFSDQWGGARIRVSAQDRPKMAVLAREEARQALEVMTANGASITFEGPKPVYKSPPFRCSDWFNESNPACRRGFDVPRAEMLARRSTSLASMTALSSGAAHINIWDPFSVLCPGRVCSAYQGGKPLYFDGDHISGYANDLLYPSFLAAIDLGGREGTAAAVASPPAS